MIITATVVIIASSIKAIIIYDVDTIIVIIVALCLIVIGVIV